MRTRSTPFTTIRTEGALLPPELLRRVADLDKDLGGLKPPDYHLGENERLGEAISRSWNRLTGVWAAFAPSLDGFGEDDPGTGITREKWLAPLFQELGFGRLETAKATEIEGRTYPISHRWREVPIHLVGAGLDLNRRTPGAKGAARSSPHSLLQELLNRTDSLWGIVSNGGSLRLLRDNVSLTRQAYVEFDLVSMFSGEVYPDFVLLWLLCHESRFEGEHPEECWLERWSQAAQQQGTRALDTLRGGVEQAISALGSGFLAHPANASLRDRLRDGKLSTQDYYRQLLRLVYRLIFLFVAEDRGLLHPPGTPEDAQRYYRDYYSSSRLRFLAERRRGSKHSDLYETLKLVMASLGRDEGRTKLGLPALGSFLWSEGATPDLDQAQLPNSHLLQATRALAFTTQGKLLRAVDYRNIGSEELGSIYESLLELHPNVHRESATFELATVVGHERKTTGSYYTPTSLINALLDSALDSVLEEAASKPDGERAILELKVLDPACGSGHFLVAAAHRISKRLAAERTGDEEPSPEAYRTALRDVIGRCVYGIDVNPMAVELCKVSLWMEAMEPGKPLSFLDHHILGGNSLLGTTPRLLAEGIPDEAFKPLEGDDRSLVSELKRRNREEREGQQIFALAPTVAELTKPLAEALAHIEEGVDASLEDLRSKEKGWASLLDSDEAAHAKLVSDAWCAAFVMPKVRGVPVLTTGVLRLLTSDPIGGDQKLHEQVRQLDEVYRFLHPHLAFPGIFRLPADGEEPDNEVMGWSGGFDVVVGNPPWERVKLQEKEWFAAVVPEIASAPNAAQRKRMIKQLREDDPSVYRRWTAALRKAEGESHLLRDSNRYPLAGRGDVNTYPVFAELMRTVLSPTGRVGAIVPTGIATDDTTKFFFRDLVDGRSLVSLFSFENEEFIFPEIHHATRFCLLTLSGSGRPVPEATFVFFARQPHHISDPERRFTLTPEDFELLNPNTRTCPVFRSGFDAELTKGIYQRVSVLIREGPPEENPWGISFMAMFHMANDSRLFRTRAQLEQEGWALDGNIFRRTDESYLPLYEAKMIHHFDHRFGTYEGQTDAQARQGKLPELTDEQHRDPSLFALPRYWVSKDNVNQVVRNRWSREWLIGFRDITGATVLRTVIPTVLPRTAVGHKLPLLLPSVDSGLAMALLANLSSFVLDYVARQKVGGTSLAYFVLKQLPILTPSTHKKPVPWEPRTPLGEWIKPRVLELTFTSNDIRGFAASVGWNGPSFSWDPERRALLRAELNAALFHIYGLSREETSFVMDTFPIVRQRDERSFGEFRTKRLVLERFDALVKAADAGRQYESPVDPPPADARVAHPLHG